MAARTWILAARPKTLPASAAPVLVGWGLAAAAGAFAPGPAVAALAGALLLQIGANLSNDAFDFAKGADQADRVGPIRVTQAGLATPRQVLTATAIVFALATAVGVYLAYVGGMAIIYVGIAAILTALAYTAGPLPLAYLGLGEVAALAFFGPVAVLGTLLVQAHTLPAPAMWLSLGPGLLSAAIMGVNNLRDRVTDARANKRTLAVRFGAGAARALYVAEVAAAFVLPVVLVATRQLPLGALACLGALPLVVGPLRHVFRSEGAVLNEALAGTAKVLLAYGVLLAVGLGSRL
ncbi:MAG: menA [Cyanobacteria bacterium RYN_339]|nr:menA [Cyanobacteria bacterium RYN_339]